MALDRHRRWKIAAVIIAILVVYVSSYLVLSRRGFAHADEWGAEGFYFLTPHDSTAWRIANYSLALVYFPLIEIDKFFGTGRGVAAEPMWGLS